MLLWILFSFVVAHQLTLPTGIICSFNFFAEENSSVGLRTTWKNKLYSHHIDKEGAGYTVIIVARMGRVILLYLNANTRVLTGTRVLYIIVNI